MSLRTAFMGTPAFAATALDALVQSGHEIACVYTQPPRPAGRGKKLRPGPVQMRAQALGLMVRTPRSLGDAAGQAAFAALDLDVAIVAAYGLILPPVILEAPRFGCINLHASLLPRWRGAAPIQRAIMAGDTMSAVQAMQMEAGLDTGPVLAGRQVPIAPDESFASLHDKLAAAAVGLLPQVLAALQAGTLTPAPQSQDGVSYAHKIDKAETRLDWSRPALELERQVRALSPAPGAWFALPAGTGTVRVKVLMAKAETGSGAPGEVLDKRLLIASGAGALRLTRLQKAGGRAQEAEDFLRGNSVAERVRLL